MGQWDVSSSIMGLMQVMSDRAQDLVYTGPAGRASYDY